MKIFNPSGHPYVQIIEIPKSEIEVIDFALCKQPTQTLDSYYKSCDRKPDILINGGLFNMQNGKTIFTYIDEGKIINKELYRDWGMGTNKAGELVIGNYQTTQFKDFVSGYPFLIEAGKRSSINCGKELDYNARRTAIGYNDKNVYVMLVDNPGLRYNKMQDIFLSLGVDYAINLDGGGSTRCLHNGKRITALTSNRPVDNLVAFYLRPRVLYRVQLGAFGLKANAERFCKEIQSLGGIYKDAYVRKVGLLWKVQVGAFSVKANAQNMQADLKSKGYNSFITT